MLKMFAPKFYFEMSILESQLALITSFVQQTTNLTQDRLIFYNSNDHALFWKILNASYQGSEMCFCIWNELTLVTIWPYCANSSKTIRK